MEKIDDRDSSIVFSEPLLGRDWSDWGGSQEYQNTTSLTRTMGANAKITFYGTSIAVYGTISTDSIDSGTTSDYSIDGGSETTYTTSPTKQTQYQVKFFESSTLNPGRHTLEVINKTPRGWFWLDYFLVANSTTVSSSTTSSSTSIGLSSITSSSPISTRSPSTTTVVFTPAFTSSTDADTPVTDSSSPSHHKGPNAGVIVGSVFGGLFGLVFLLALIWIVRRKLADRYADQAAAIPTDAAIPSPTSKGFAPAHQSYGSRTIAGYEIPVSPTVMAQVHHQREQSSKQQQQLQHSRYGSNVSTSNVYPFSPAAGLAQQAYHPNAAHTGQRGQVPVSPYIASAPQYHPQPHGRQHSMALPPRVNTPLSSHSYSNSTGGGVGAAYSPRHSGQGANPGVYGPNNGTNATEQVRGRYGGQGVIDSAPSDNSLSTAYPGPPPGLSDPRT